MTAEEYRNYLETDFDDVDLKELKDIRKIRIDRNHTKEKRIAQYLRQVGNPYLVCIGNVKVKIRFGGFLCMTGGDNSSTFSSVSAEVEAYEPLIRQYANQYGIGEYVELIKAIMMQESGGRGLDPMQCSEGSFNTKYPKQPNGITDPEYSISCGVQEIKSCLERAGVKNPLDMENIKLALQSYNFGNGYLEWAKARGGYTLANAAEFSDMMAQRMGWSSYGDKQYVPHVLQYYTFGRIPTGIGNQAIVQVATSQEGKGGTTYWSWYGLGNRVEWCACFVSWCAD